MKNRELTEQNIESRPNRRKFSLERSICFLIVAQLSLTPTVLAASSDSDVLTNNTLPLEQPAPSRLVQKIWSSLDVHHKTTPNKQIAVKEQPDNSQPEAPAGSGTAIAADRTNSVENSAGTDTSVATASKTEATTPASGAQADQQMRTGSPDNNIESASTTATTPVAENSPGKNLAAAEPGPGTNAAAAAVIETSGANTSVASDTSATAEDKPIKIVGVLGMVTLPPGAVLSRVSASEPNVVVVDNDEAQEAEETLKPETLPVTEDGKMHAKAGARFPVVLASQITSRTAKASDPIKARLKYDLKIGERLVASKGSLVNGHVNYVLPARTIMRSLLSPERWYRNSGCLGLSFDEIINDKGEHLPLSALPSRQARIVKNKAEGRELGVNHNGQVAGPWSEQLRYKALRVGLNFALAPAGVFSFGAMPVALGVLGAANPSFAFAKPIGLNVRHRRLKGFAWGFLSGIPGSFLIEDTTIKGQEAIVKPGDEFYAELVQEFTGQPSTGVELMPGVSTKIHGEVMNASRKSRKKAK